MKDSDMIGILRLILHEICIKTLNKFNTATKYSNAIF